MPGHLFPFFMSIYLRCKLPEAELLTDPLNQKYRFQPAIFQEKYFFPFLRRKLGCKNVCGQSVPEKPQFRPLFPPTTLISLAPVTQTMRSQQFYPSFHFFSDRMRRKGPNKKKQFLKHMFNVAKFSGWQVVKKKNTIGDGGSTAL